MPENHPFRAPRLHDMSGSVVVKIVGVAVIGLVLVGGYFFTRHQNVYHAAARELPKEMELARKEGLALTAAELLPTIPKEQNAAGFYKQAIDRYTSQKLGKGWTDAATALNEGRHAGARRLLKDFQPLYPLLAQGAARPSLQFERDWSDPVMTLFPEYAHMKTLVKACALDAELLAHEGKREAALERLRVAARMGEHMGQEPTLISMLVQLAMSAIVNRSAERISSAKAGDARWQEALLKFARTGYGEKPDMLHALGGEVLFAASAPDHVGDPKLFGEMSEGESPIKPVIGVDSKTRADAYRLRALNFWRRAFAEMRPHRGDPSAITDALVKVHQEEEKRFKEPTYEFNAVVLPVFSQAGKAVVRMDANRRLLEVRTALMLHRIRTGRFPASLAEAKIDVTDPFDGQPIRYRPEPNGFRIWSIGVDGKDDGGSFRNANTGQEDVVMTHPFSLR